jgi:hypothetical protein
MFTANAAHHNFLYLILQHLVESTHHEATRHVNFSVPVIFIPKQAQLFPLAVYFQ